jgi:MFS family permease
MYTLGFAIFTIFSILLTVTWMTGTKAALWIIIMRVGQGVGGAFLFANSNAIITDAFPATNVASPSASTVSPPSVAPSWD